MTLVKNEDLHWLSLLQNMVDHNVADVVLHAYQKDGVIQLRVYPKKLPSRISKYLTTKLKQSLPLGYLVSVIVPPVKRNDIPLMKGSQSYYAPFFSIEILNATKRVV